MTTDTSMLGDDYFCAVCKKYILAGRKVVPPSDNQSEGPYFCSHECAESAYSFPLPSEPTNELQPGYYVFPDGKEYHTSSRQAQKIIPQMQAEVRAKYNEDLALAKRRRAESMGYFVKRYRRDQQKKKQDAIDADNEQYLSDLRKRHAKEREEEAKQKLADEKVAAKEAERLRLKEERDAERRARDEEREAEKQRIKEEEQYRLEEEEYERTKTIPLEIPSDHSRFENVHILGPAGSGKTTLIQEFIYHDLTRSDSPGLIVIDPKGTLIERLKALNIVDDRRLVIIDATHSYPAKLGLFAKSAVTGVDPEQVISQAVSTYTYIFQSTDFKFTPKQSILFEYVVRLMFEIDGTLSTMMQFLRTDFKKPNEYDAVFDRLPDDMREFFKIDLKDSYESTAKEINVRLQKIRQKPTLRTMFDTTERRVDLFDCMRKRKIVLVNTGMSRDAAASQMIGRFIIAMTLNATYIRALMPKYEWHPTFLMIDEFQEFVDAEKTPEMLRKVREYNVGVMMAHHNMYGSELDDAMRVAISTNTSVKFCADPRGQDLSYMARDFGCDPSFLRMQQVTDTDVRFAHVMRRVYDTPVSVTVPRGNLEGLKRRSEEELWYLDNWNILQVHGERYFQTRTEPPAPTPTHQTEPQQKLATSPKSDDTDDWA
jgi:ABC-type molybdenum transport system ATPase subunit/photorepair protein PhrA